MRRIFNPQKEMGYRFMVWGFKIMDLFGKPDRRLNDFDIMQGSVVVDYGCGPGRYIQKASELVGPAGRVYAVDISRMAIDIVRKNRRQQSRQRRTGSSGRRFAGDRGPLRRHRLRPGYVPSNRGPRRISRRHISDYKKRRYIFS